jgi:hypothetical protein
MNGDLNKHQISSERQHRHQLQDTHKGQDNIRASLRADTFTGSGRGPYLPVLVQYE